MNDKLARQRAAIVSTIRCHALLYQEGQTESGFARRALIEVASAVERKLTEKVAA